MRATAGCSHEEGSEGGALYGHGVSTRQHGVRCIELPHADSFERDSWTPIPADSHRHDFCGKCGRSLWRHRMFGPIQSERFFRWRRKWCRRSSSGCCGSTCRCRRVGSHCGRAWRRSTWHRRTGSLPPRKLVITRQPVGRRIDPRARLQRVFGCYGFGCLRGCTGEYGKT
jgi:hypothetical protein